MKLVEARAPFSVLRAHAGLSPQFVKFHETLEACLTGTDAVALCELSMPQAGPDAVLKAIIDGVKEFRSDAVTRQALFQYYALQTNEMRTHVQAELVPIHDGISEVPDLCVQLETRGASGGQSSSDPNPYEPAFAKLLLFVF